jgi:hypothetical protein
MVPGTVFRPVSFEKGIHPPSDRERLLDRDLTRFRLIPAEHFLVHLIIQTGGTYWEPEPIEQLIARSIAYSQG